MAWIDNLQSILVGTAIIAGAAAALFVAGNLGLDRRERDDREERYAMWRTFLRRWLKRRRGYPLPPYRRVTFHTSNVRQSRG